MFYQLTKEIYHFIKVFILNCSFFIILFNLFQSFFVSLDYQPKNPDAVIFQTYCIFVTADHQ